MTFIEILAMCVGPAITFSVITWAPHLWAAHIERRAARIERERAVPDHKKFRFSRLYFLSAGLLSMCAAAVFIVCLATTRTVTLSRVLFFGVPPAIIFLMAAYRLWRDSGCEVEISRSGVTLRDSGSIKEIPGFAIGHVSVSAWHVVITSAFSEGRVLARLSMFLGNSSCALAMLRQLAAAGQRERSLAVDGLHGSSVVRQAK